MMKPCALIGCCADWRFHLFPFDPNLSEFLIGEFHWRVTWEEEEQGEG